MAINDRDYPPVVRDHFGVHVYSGSSMTLAAQITWASIGEVASGKHWLLRGARYRLRQNPMRDLRIHAQNLMNAAVEQELTKIAAAD